MPLVLSRLFFCPTFHLDSELLQFLLSDYEMIQFPKKIEYRESFTLFDLQSQGHFVINVALSFRGWSVRFIKKENGKLSIDMGNTRDDDISQAVIRHVKFTIRCGTVEHKSSDADFPVQILPPGLTFSWGCELIIPENKDSLDVEVCLIFNDVEQQVKDVHQYLESHPDTIGHLTDEDLNE